MEITKKIFKILGLIIMYVLTGLLLQFSYVWIFQEVKTEMARFIIIAIASGNLYWLTGILMDSMYKIAKGKKNIDNGK